MRILLFGATGLIGSQVLRLALANPDIHVIAPSRRPLAPHPRLTNPITADLIELLSHVAVWKADALIWAAGTTMRAAKSKEEFRRIDHDFPLSFGRTACDAGMETVVFLSAQGASINSHIFYLRLKATTERDLETLGFRSVTMIRPGFISGREPAKRISERLLALFQPLLPRSLRQIPVQNVARAAVEAARNRKPGVAYVGNKEMSPCERH